MSYFSQIFLKNIAGSVINPSTSDKQDLLLTELKLKADLTETQPVSIDALPIAVNTDRDTNIDGLSSVITASAMYGRLSDTAIKMARIDRSTHTLMDIDYSHHEIHDGTHFNICINKDIPNGGTYNLAFTTPNTTTWAHMLFDVSVELEAEVIIYEGVTSYTGGTAITPLNNNRNSPNASVLTNFLVDTTVTLGTPTMICGKVVGSGKSSGGGLRGEEERVLKQDTKYYVVVTNQAVGSANEANVELLWYEHADRT